ncbi:hypothetical protein LIER_33040 [Lithospermum erythrorhizon]|uniref:Uncharacterized protein n=1 Tax=Lithospermum erythrorhizon TaxID=34254 RepID=A0AAV3RWX7_LITER
MASRPTSLEYTPSFPSYREQRKTWLRLCCSLQGKTLSELGDMVDEVLGHLANGQAFNFSFLLVLCRGLECYFEKVRSALQVISKVDYWRAFHLPVLEEAFHEAETRIVDARDHLAKTVMQLVRDEASFGDLLSSSAPFADVEVSRQLIA